MDIAFEIEWFVTQRFPERLHKPLIILISSIVYPVLFFLFLITCIIIGYIIFWLTLWIFPVMREVLPLPE